MDTMVVRSAHLRKRLYGDADEFEGQECLAILYDLDLLQRVAKASVLAFESTREELTWVVAEICPCISKRVVS